MLGSVCVKKTWEHVNDLPLCGYTLLLHTIYNYKHNNTTLDLPFLTHIQHFKVF
jgi:hypothetical protein